MCNNDPDSLKMFSCSPKKRKNDVTPKIGTN